MKFNICISQTSRALGAGKVNVPILRFFQVAFTPTSMTETGSGGIDGKQTEIQVA